MATRWTPEGTLLLSDFRFSNVGEESRMGCTAVGIVPTGVVEAEGSVDCMTDIVGVGVFLAVVFPPADGAKPHCGWGFQSPEAAAGTAVSRHN